MKRILLTLLLLSGFISKGQELEEAPLDTLTRTVDLMRQELDARKRLTIGGYIQAQFQQASTAGITSFEGGNFPNGINKRMQLRRGRVKIEYTGPYNDKLISPNNLMLQIDVTERGVRLMDCWAKFIDPWTGWFGLTFGLQNRPFGYEIIYSSSNRESPERGRMSQLLFPNERDMGAMVTIQAPKLSRWHWFKIEAGMFNGMSAPNVGLDVSDFDNKKDFIGHVVINRSNVEETIKYSGGFSYYRGGYRIDSVNYYRSESINGQSGFALVSNATENFKGGLINSRGYNHREYYGVDAQTTFSWAPGLTTLRGEYIFGDQPGISTSSAPAYDLRSPISGSVTKDIYQRKFNGAYFYLIQRILDSKFQLVLKYDWFDPNTNVKGNQIGKPVVNGVATSASDIRYDNYGAGLIYNIDAGIKLMLYYDMPKNETTENLSAYKKDISDNVLTIRLQATY